MKHQKWLLAALIGAAVSIAAAGILTRHLPGRSRVEAAYCANAGLVGPDHEFRFTALNEDVIHCYALLAGRHVLRAGENVVIMHHRTVDPRRFTHDDERFEFFSLEMPDDRIGQELRLPTDGVRLAFSRGSLTWLPWCRGQFSDIGRGTIRTKRLDKKRLSVSVDLEIVARDATGLRDEQLVQFRESFVALERPLDRQNLVPSSPIGGSH